MEQLSIRERAKLLLGEDRVEVRPERQFQHGDEFTTDTRGRGDL
jgi:hypothetical protein